MGWVWTNRESHSPLGLGLKESPPTMDDQEKNDRRRGVLAGNRADASEAALAVAGVDSRNARGDSRDGGYYRQCSDDDVSSAAAM